MYARDIKHSSLHTSFIEGIKQLDSGDYYAALESFRIAHQQKDLSNTSIRALYASYYGLARVYIGNETGVSLCRQAALQNLFDVDIFYNLALAEHKLNNRRRALVALKQGYAINAQHVGLHRLRLLIGSRRKPFVRFLKRDHFINRVIGRLTYPKGQRSARLTPSAGNRVRI